ncbi:MAG: response regulator [Treponema sp.]|jgi:putative two-component system response regulator|nr:response regulator [Treponema sp.]
MKTIFVVDDSDTNLSMAETALEDIYRVMTVPSAVKMFNLLEKITPDMILLDIEMPDIDGFTALQRLQSHGVWVNIPVMFLTGRTDAEVEVRGFEMGAVDFLLKPFSPSVLKNRIKTHLNIDRIIRERTDMLNRMQNSIVEVLADMVENRDKGTGGHIERTSIFIRILLEGMKARGVYKEEIGGWDIDKMISSARMHDLGKISITDLIINKPGKLTPEEYHIMKTHAVEGERIIDEIIARTGDGDFLRNAKLFAGNHHERWDGKGYPRGLKGEEIPLHGRIMAIVDVYDALVHERPYKKAFTFEEAVKIIMENSGTHYDPKIVKVFFEVKEQFRDVKAGS